MFDVGHGDCVLLSNNAKFLLVDIGARWPRWYQHVARQVEASVPPNNVCGLVVSHYHWDHYSLFRTLTRPEGLFSKIYFPALPVAGPGWAAGQAMRDFLLAATLGRFGYYAILPEVFRRFRSRIVSCQKGERISEGNMDLLVLWPDFSSPLLRTKRIIRTATHVRQTIEPLLKRHNIPFPSELTDDYTTDAFLDQLTDLRYREMGEESMQALNRVLGEIEHDFRGLADTFSLAIGPAADSTQRPLFLGDLPDPVLNRLDIPQVEGAYDVVKSAHHGTRFGRKLVGLTTRFLLVSRNRYELPRVKDVHRGYLYDMNSHLRLNTECLGTCLIR